MRWYKEIFYLSWHFGFRAIWNITFRPRFVRSYTREDGILSFMKRVSKKKFDDLKSIKQQELDALSDDCNIWVCWLQGEANMPKTIRQCYNSLLRNKGSHKVILITNDNLNDYVSLPDHIVAKHNEGIISNTHFSDVIRCYLLWKYGGIWIDAALYVVKEIGFHNVGFYTPKFTNEDLINLKWTIGCLVSSPGFCLFSFAYRFLVDYWNLYNVPVTYLLLDYVLELAYRNNRDIKRVIDEIPINNRDLHSSRYLFNEKCDEKEFQRLIQNNSFLSLTWRLQYHINTEKGDLTYYGRLLQEFEN